MRSVRFTDPAGTVRHGNWTTEGVVAGGRTYDPDAVSFLPPTEPEKVIAVGRNNAERVRSIDAPVPEVPRLFFKPPHTLVGHGHDVRLPPGSDEVVFEAELGVVIGAQCRDVPESEAMDVVAGYTCVDDVSNLDDRDVDPGGVRTKGFDAACAVGPGVVPRPAVPDDARIACRVNGDLRQESTVDKTVFSQAEVIAEITSYLTLQPGDVISMGTPPGIGPLSPGDEVRISIEGVGTLEHGVRAP